MEKKRFFNSESSAKGKYVNIILCVILYLVSSLLLRELARENSTIKVMYMESSTLRGILTQFQMLISIYLVLRENKVGYITAVLINVYSIFVSVVFLIRNISTTSLPGVISYLGVLIIITLIINYKRKKSDYIEEIENQKKILVESEGKLHQMAFYDPLTELPNKELFTNRLEQTIHMAKRNASLIGVIFIDLDSFKSINDTVGHTAGDNVLMQMADRLSSCLRKEDTVSRFGGDEFLVQTAAIEKVEDLYKISNKIMDVFKNPITVLNSEFFISASVGVAVYPVDGEDSETLIKNADLAMYSAKNKGKNQCIFCSRILKNDITKKLKLTNSLYRALDKNELFLYYQPQVKVETQEIIGFEALLRWNNEEYGMVSPDVFIPLAEKTGLIKPIGLWVIKTVCEQCKICRDIYKKDMRISINLSLEQLKDANIIYNINKILDDTQTEAKNIQIEITEGIAFNEEPYVLQRLNELKNLGFSISIDDFGTGHSSLSRLKTFPIDLIKIDMEFVRGISSKSQKDKAIVKSIIQIAKNLGIKVLAEGVETEEQFMYLREEKCDEIQGYYFYKPMTADEIKTIMTNNYAIINNEK